MKKFAIVIICCFLGAGTATATLTTILPGPEVPLDGNGGILDQIYGLGNLTRIDDDFDQIWNPASGTATAMAKFAGYTQEFGYIPDLNNDGNYNESFMPLFTVAGNGLNLNTPTVPVNSGGANFLWALDPSGAPLWTSLPGQNSDGRDHLVTWLINGGSGNTAGNYVLAWEDLPRGGDRDFNDLVLEVSVGKGPHPTPEPASLLLFGAGIAGLAGFGRKKFFKK